VITRAGAEFNFTLGLVVVAETALNCLLATDPVLQIGAASNWSTAAEAAANSPMHITNQSESLNFRFGLQRLRACAWLLRLW